MAFLSTKFFDHENPYYAFLTLHGVEKLDKDGCIVTEYSRVYFKKSPIHESFEVCSVFLGMKHSPLTGFIITGFDSFSQMALILENVTVEKCAASSEPM